MLLEHASARSMLNSNQQCLDRLFKVAAGFLDEGALMFWTSGSGFLCPRLQWHLYYQLLPTKIESRSCCLPAHHLTGALETRTFGKRILFNIKACLDSRSDLDRLLSLVHPDMLTRKVLSMITA